ncbi:MAG: GHKL domain-containing protein [Bacteroidales bacterium]|nr:GHKL domain-containing protein [Bacteroidales bacterium]
MDFSQTYSKRSCVGCLIMGLLAIFFLIVIPWQRERRENPKEILKRFEAFLQEHESHIQDELRFVSENFLTNPSADLTKEQLAAIPNPDDRELTLLIYQNDSLIFWSDNSVPFYAFDISGTDSLPEIRKLANGWYELSVFKKGIFSMVGLCLVKQAYPFQNQYLRNTYTGIIQVPDDVKISLEKGQHNAFSSEGNFLCSLEIPENLPPQQDQGWLVFLLIAAFLFLIAFLYRVSSQLQAVIKNNYWLFFILTADIVLLRGLQFFARWPASLYNSELFGPVLYSSSRLFPSLGDFLLNSLLILVVGFIFYQTWPAKQTGIVRPPWKRSVHTVLYFLVSLLALLLVMAGINSLVIHSTLPMNLENISRLSWESIPAFASISFLGLAWILLTLRLTVETKAKKFPFAWFFLAMALFAVGATVVLNRANNQREKEQRELIALQLAARQNPVTEMLLQQLVDTILQDPHIRQTLAVSGRSEADQLMTDDSTTRYLLQHFFKDYWNNYNVLITICRPSKTLRIQPQGFVIGCSAYFDEVIASFGKNCQEGIYFLDYGYGNENYISRLPITGSETILYVEISSRSTYRDLGYPELLVDRRTYDVPDLADYSYAFFQGNQLVHRVGEYTYGFDLSGYVDTVTGNLLTSSDRMDHFLYRINNTDTLLISKPLPTSLSIISPFSYLLIFMFLLFGAGYGIGHLGDLRPISALSLRNRLQLSMLGMIITLFIITGLLMMVYLTWLNSEKNEENLMERTLSILIEVEHKFDNLGNLQDAEVEELENVLIKFSNVFFSDINLYNPQGVLLASSRPRIFQEGLISDLINPQAYRRLHQKRTSMFVQTEHIGGLNYLSAYVPFYNTQNKLLGYLNLPYFSRQDDLRREISTFLIAFINIYVLFFLIGALVTYLVSNYITSPLKLLAQRIGRIRIGKTNDKLVWRRNDEIGTLVGEYNRMLDELIVSAERLAVSERESAWREMAQQVAHEIKNPLTPMKLGVQYLQKAWEEGAEDWDIRLKRFSDALIVQIDTLSSIASEFSYFARMPEPENAILNLDDLIRDALLIYKDVSAIQVSFHPSPPAKWVYADQRQLLRVFSNLINNAIEAIEARPDTEGKIAVETENTEGETIVRISDNGKGIGPEEADNIFQPNFTTRSGGAGLGLAIVKGIIHSVGGSVTFTSEPGKMTTFTIRFPAASVPKMDEQS